MLFKGIKRDNIYIKASALTFFSILSATADGSCLRYAKGFGLSDQLRAQIIMQFHTRAGDELDP